MSNGREFQRTEAAIGNERRPTVVESWKFAHFEGLPPLPFVMGLANDHLFLN